MVRNPGPPDRPKPPPPPIYPIPVPPGGSNPFSAAYYQEFREKLWDSVCIPKELLREPQEYVTIPLKREAATVPDPYIDWERLSDEQVCRFILEHYWGFQDFRPGQFDSMAPILRGQDSLLVMPTGGGKSLCYQIPAHYFHKATGSTALVISPLIALMKDQVDALKTRGIKAEFLNSSQSRKESDEVLQLFSSGSLALLYVAPERFKNPAFLDVLTGALRRGGEAKISFLAVDEAHCHPAGTRILTPTGVMAIEDFRAPDFTGESHFVMTSEGPSAVVEVKSRKVPVEDMVTLALSDGTKMDTTKDHPVFLAGVGYVPAAFLEKGDTCYAVDSVSALREGIPVQVKGAWKETVGFLFAGLLEDVDSAGYGDEKLPYLLSILQSQGFLDADILHGTVWATKGSRCCVGANDPRQSNEAARRASEGLRRLERMGPDRLGEKGWQRANYVHTTEDGWRLVSFLDPGAQNSDRENERRPASRSEGGLGGPDSEACRRGGRPVSQVEEGPRGRSSEGDRSDSGRMVFVESVERGRSLRESSSEVEVFSLEVGGPHNYFANGVLVHNCISQWGHDFRPDYRRLGDLKDMLDTHVFATTATATVKVQDDIVKQLRMEDPCRKVTGFDRPNLSFEVEHFPSEIARDRAFESLIVDILQEAVKTKTMPSVLIYCGTRKATDEVTKWVNKIANDEGWNGVVITSYHAGLKDADRKLVQDDFMSGRLPWVAATCAFGMGVDKSDIRYVIHYAIPGSVEAYYQEVGRAGRDGKDSRTILYSCRRDESLGWFFIEMANPAKRVIQNVYDVLWQHKQPILRKTYEDVYYDYTQWFGREDHQAVVETAIRLLKKAGALDINSPRGQIWMGTGEKLDDLGDLMNWKLLALKRERDSDRFRDMLNFVKSGRDKRAHLLEYFGESDEPKPTEKTK